MKTYNIFLLGIYRIIGEIVSRLLCSDFYRAKIMTATTSRKIKYVKIFVV